MRDPIRLCLNTLHRGRECNELLRLARMPDGSVRYLCQRCNWREAGRCWQCGATRTNHPKMGVFCDPCGHANQLANCRKWHHANKAAKRQYDAQRWADGTAQPERNPNRPRAAV